MRIRKKEIYQCYGLSTIQYRGISAKVVATLTHVYQYLEGKLVVILSICEILLPIWVYVFFVCPFIYIEKSNI